MVQLESIVNYLNSLLPPSEFRDAGLNGLQVDAGNEIIKKVAVAVDAGLSVCEAAVKEEADLLICHHGIYWGKGPSPVTGNYGKKIRYLIDKGLSLYSSHLPLDANKEVGNNFELGRYIGLEELTPFFEYDGALIGARGRYKTALPLEEISAKLDDIPGAGAKTTFPFGQDKITTVGIITGSAADAIPHCAELGLDLFISGEPKQEAYHTAKEHSMNALFAGHYATETFGVRALAKRIEKDLDLKTVFIDEPTGV